MPGIFPFIGETREAAEKNYNELQDLIPKEMGLELLSSYLGDTDLSGYELNTPFEDIEIDQGNNIQSRVDLIKETAKKHHSTLEDVMNMLLVQEVIILSLGRLKMLQIEWKNGLRKVLQMALILWHHSILHNSNYL